MRLPKCPCCGQPVQISALLISVDDQQLAYGGKTILLTPNETKFLTVLKKKMPKHASHSTVFFALWGSRPPQTANASLSMMLSALRRKLEPLGLRVLTLYGRGYQLARVGVDVRVPAKSSSRRAA